MSIKLRYNGLLDAYGWETHLRVFSLLYVFWMVVFFIHNLFEIQTLRRYSSLLFNLISATLVNLLVATIYFYFQPNLILTPRRFLLIHLSLAFVLMLCWHLLVKYILKNRLLEPIYLFSFNRELEELENEIKASHFFGYKVLGHLNEQSLATTVFDRGSGIILPDNLATKPEILSKFYKLRTLGVRFYNHKSFYERLLRRIYLSQIDEVWFLENIDYKEKRFYNLVKKLVDVLAGIFFGLVFLITFPVCALLIKLSGSGQIFFIQERVGKGGKVFRVYKYRSMTGGPTNTWTSVNDPRITKIGKFFRKSRIDELPQFINLLFGNMSLVGPRPEQAHIVEDMGKQIPFYDERHLVKPGITGWAQLNIYAGSVEETKLKLQYDLYYIKHRSFLFDLEIILKTIYYIFSWRGR